MKILEGEIKDLQGRIAAIREEERILSQELSSKWDDWRNIHTAGVTAVVEG